MKTLNRVQKIIAGEPALLTIGYMVSRGLAKAGTPSRDTDPRTDR